MAAGKATYRFDFKVIFGKSPKDEALRARIEQRAIDMIRERTQSGLDRFGKKFEPYSEAYKNSLAFKAAGKTDQVNMTLHSDMLSLLDVRDRVGSSTWIGWEDETQNAKAYRHTTGDKGMPVRDFLGLTAHQERQLRNEFIDDVERSVSENTSEDERAALSLIEIIRTRFLGDNDGD